jgi:hypothetical protein
MGVQDLRDPSGYIYQLPIGHDQYWRDNQGNFWGGSWLTNPDPTWYKLEPTGT